MWSMQKNMVLHAMLSKNMYMKKKENKKILHRKKISFFLKTIKWKESLLQVTHWNGMWISDPPWLFELGVFVEKKLNLNLELSL